MAKLLVALRHHVDHHRRAALILEDDAVVDVGRAAMQALADANPKLERAATRRGKRLESRSKITQQATNVHVDWRM